MAEKNDRHLCPVCGKFYFDSWDSMDYCEVCDWGDDAIQENDPDYKGGENKMSLNEAREAWKKGIQIR